MTVKELLAKDPDGDDKLPAFAWPGGYPILYYCKDGTELCPDCANLALENFGVGEEDKPKLADVYYEGPSVFCGHCNKEVESAYGDPDAPEEA